MTIKSRTAAVLLTAALTVPGAVAVASTAVANPGDITAAVQTRTRTMWVVDDNTNVREFAGSSYDIIRVLNKGDKVTVVKTSMGWSDEEQDNVRWSNLSTGGWVRSDLLSRKAPIDPSHTSAGWHTIYATHVRSGPSTDFGLLRELPKGAAVKVLDDAIGWNEDQQADSLWYHIEGGGWVDAEYIQKDTNIVY